MKIESGSLLPTEPVGSSAVLAAAPAALDAAVSAPRFGAATVGTPVAVPPTVILFAFNTTGATILRLPEERMLAVPATTVPCGARRSVLDFAATLEVCSTP